MIRRTCAMLVLALVVSLAGCSGGFAGGSGDASPTDSETPSPTVAGTVTESAEAATPSPTATGSPGSVVTTPSAFARVSAGETGRLNYRGRNVTVSYTRTQETSRVVVDMGKHRRTVRRNRTASAETMSWSWDGLRFVLKPVTLEQRDGNPVYLFQGDWNTSHVEVEVYCAEDCT